MAGISLMEFGHPVFIDFTPDFEVGSQPPSGYTDWHSWADKQHEGGLRQLYCGGCSKWLFPQEICKCGVKRLNQRQLKQVEREAAKMVKPKDTEKEYRKAVRKARKKGEIK